MLTQRLAEHYGIAGVTGVEVRKVALPADSLLRAVAGADKALIADVTVFDLYKLEGAKKSLAIEVTLQPRDKTLTEPEIEAVSQKIVQAVTKATGGTLRS